MAERTQWDDEYYAKFLKGEIPDHLCDAHVHIWTKAHRTIGGVEGGTAGWVHDFCMKNDLPYSGLQKLYKELLPGKAVSSLVFGWVESDVDVAAENRYVGEQTKNRPHLKGLAVCKPAYTPEQLALEVEGNGLVGLKPYPTFVTSVPAADVRVGDMVTRDQLRLADEKGWVVLLHLPRAGRLADRANIEDILMIEREYPRVRLIVAHIGRAYCPENIGSAFDALSGTKNMMFDFAANTNEEVLKQTLRVFGEERIMFGSDLPISAMRLKREHAGGTYINIVPAGSLDHVSGDPHMREAGEEESCSITFFLYESMAAMVRAAKGAGLGAQGMEKIFYSNAIDFFEI